MTGSQHLGEDVRLDAAIRLLAQRFAAGDVSEPAAGARVLVLGALGLDRAAAVRRPETPLGGASALIRAWAERRMRGEPVSRILGRREFWSLDVLVTSAVLDPRPDTETVVLEALRLLERRRSEALQILDLGTGSGALLCALLHEFPEATGVGLEASREACAVARANVARLGFAERCRIVHGDWVTFASAPHDLVVANPPYVPTLQIEALDREVRLFDPRPALDGGDDGLRAYREISNRLPRFLAAGGLFIGEVGQGQSEPVAGLLRSAGLDVLNIRADLAGTPRAVAAALQPEQITVSGAEKHTDPLGEAAERS